MKINFFPFSNAGASWESFVSSRKPHRSSRPRTLLWELRLLESVIALKIIIIIALQICIREIKKVFSLTKRNIKMN